MASSRQTIESIEHHLDESLGFRHATPPIHLSPRPQAKDIGRRPIPDYGTVDINLVMPDPSQPRAEFAQESIDRLAESIKGTGQLAPIRVRWSEKDKKWVIVFGERRWRAVQKAGLSVIQCHFHEDSIPQSEILEQQLVENCLRDDLKPIEEAQAFACLMNVKGWNGKQLAGALHITETRVTRALALLKLPQEIQQEVTAGKIPKRSAYELSKLENENVQKELARDVTSKGMSTSQLEKSVHQRKGKPKTKSTVTKQTFVVEGGWKITVSRRQKSNYDEMLEAIEQVRQEIQHRINNGIQIF